MRSDRFFLALAILSLTITSLFAAVAAQTVPGQAWVSDSANPSAPPEDEFLPGQTVYIHWLDFLAPATIRINHTTGTVDKSFPVMGSGVETFESQIPGKYDVWVDFEKVCEFRRTSFIVVPEVLFGSLGAVGAALAAGLVYYRRNRR